MGLDIQMNKSNKRRELHRNKLTYISIKKETDFGIQTNKQTKTNDQTNSKVGTNIQTILQRSWECLRFIKYK